MASGVERKNKDKLTKHVPNSCTSQILAQRYNGKNWLKNTEHFYANPLIYFTLFD